jgi:hypothetical protein
MAHLGDSGVEIPVHKVSPFIEVEMIIVRVSKPSQMQMAWHNDIEDIRYHETER